MRRIVLAVVLVAVILPVPWAEAQEASPVHTSERLSGADRIGTALAVTAWSEERCGDKPGCDYGETAIIARADAYPDALAAAPLAGILRGPVLLTGADGLDPAVAERLRQMDTREVVLMGGPAALDFRVEDDLEAVGIGQVSRVSGQDRYETAAAAARMLVERGGDTSMTLLVQGADADPRRGWPDAVAAGALAVRLGAPLLLTSTGSLPPATADTLRSTASALLVIGGESSVSASVFDEAADLSSSSRRIGGLDRYETSAQVAVEMLNTGASPATSFFATGADYPDALTAGPAAAAAGGVLLLVDPDASGGTSAEGFIAAHLGQFRELLFVGGTAAINEAETHLRRATGMCDVVDPRGPFDMFLGVAFDVPGDDLQPDNGEHVLICNAADLPLDISGWYLENIEGTDRITLPEGATAAPHSFFRVYSGPGTPRAAAHFANRDEEFLGDVHGSLDLFEPDGRLTVGVSWLVCDPEDC